MSVLKSLAAELTPEWMREKESVPPSAAEEDTDKPPMPAPTWKPDVDNPPLKPQERDGDQDEDQENLEDQDRGASPGSSA